MAREEKEARAQLGPEGDDLAWNRAPPSRQGFVTPYGYKIKASVMHYETSTGREPQLVVDRVS
jgi:hypothetical protein